MDSMLPMSVAMMRVGEMRVPMNHRLVPVRMHMCAQRLVTVMPVMVVMLVGMLVLQGIVPVVVLVALGQVQPDADAHQGRRSD